MSAENAAATPRWLDGGEQRAWRDWLFGGFKIVGELGAHLQQHAGISASQFHILVTASEGPAEGIPMGELSVSLLLPPSSVTYQVGKLAEDGWVRVARDATDARSRRVQLTDEGLVRLQTAAGLHVEEVRRVFFDKLTSEEVEILGRLASKLRHP